MRGNLEIVRLRSGMYAKFVVFGFDVAGCGIVCSIVGWMCYYINSTSPDMMCFLTAEYRIKKMLPSSNVISSPLQLARAYLGDGVLWKCDLIVNWRSYHPTEDGFIHIRFLNHLLVPGIIEVL